MRAVVIAQAGSPLALREVPRPAPAPGRVLVRVHATGVNRADLLQAAGRYPVPPGSPEDIPGLEFAGEVAELGSGVENWSVGDRVFGIAGGGTYAEYVVVHAGSLMPMPPSLDWIAAAAIPEAFITAHDALITQAMLQPGEAVLIHAVGSGVGLAAVQVTRWRGAVPYGTTRTADKLSAARRYGLADGVVIAADLAAMAPAVSAWVGDRGIDVVLDLVGGEYVGAGLDVLGMNGRLMLVGTVAGNRAVVNLGTILRKRLAVRGTVLRARSDAEKAQATAAFVRDLLPAIAAGTLASHVHAVFPIAAAGNAHELVRADGNVGKVVLTLD